MSSVAITLAGQSFNRWWCADVRAWQVEVETKASES